MRQRLQALHDLKAALEADAFREGWAPILSSLETFRERGEPMPRIRKLEEEGRPAAG